MAAKERITFYDASYILVARNHRLTLVTEDTKLYKVAAKYAKTTAGKDIV